MRYLLTQSLAILVSFSVFSTPSFSKLPLVCLTQIVAHPALDKTREGIVDELKSQGFQDSQNLILSTEIAQGQPALASQIAQKCVGQGARVVVAIGTTMAQACASAAIREKTPVVFSSVTDPIGAKLVKNLEQPGANVTGASNATSSQNQLEMFLTLVPHLKKLGVIMNPGEANSRHLYEQMKKVAQSKGVTLVQGVATKTSEVAQAARSLVGEVDALFVDNDNTALAAFSSIVAVSQQYKIPLFVSDADIVQEGALAALGPDQYTLGRQTGEIIARLLKNEKPGEIPVVFPKDIYLVVNKKVAKKIELELSEKIIKDARVVIE